MNTPDPARLDTAKHHADWLRIASFEDSRDAQTGYQRSSLFKVADFGATVRARPAGWQPSKGRGRPKTTWIYDWVIDRQLTDREPRPLDRHGRPRNWDVCLAEGTEPTIAKAKSAALAAMKQLRAAHIAAGGDVGYGDDPTGDEIRAAMR